TYLDETLRIGRGGDESLFILNKVNDLPNLS
ncbi:PAP/fibrillin family protein, partial [Anabaena sp. UHCC 0204]